MHRCGCAAGDHLLLTRGCGHTTEWGVYWAAMHACWPAQDTWSTRVCILQRAWLGQMASTSRADNETRFDSAVPQVSCACMCCSICRISAHSLLACHWVLVVQGFQPVVVAAQQPPKQHTQHIPEA